LVAKVTTLEAEEVAADWAVATVAEAAAVQSVAMAAANRVWPEALVAEAVSKAEAGAANRAAAPESAGAMVAAAAPVGEVAPAWAVDPAVAMALEGELVVVLVLRHQTGSFRPEAENRCLGNEWFAAELALRVLPTRVSERKLQFLRSFPLFNSSGDAPANRCKMFCVRMACS
jgi:hypothetical protein